MRMGCIVWRSARTARTLASGSFDGTVISWDAATGTRKATLAGHEWNVNDVAFSPDGRTLASASDDSTVILWDAATGTHKATLTGHEDGVVTLAFSPGRPYACEREFRRHCDPVGYDHWHTQGYAYTP